MNKNSLVAIILVAMLSTPTMHSMFTRRTIAKAMASNLNGPQSMQVRTVTHDQSRLKKFFGKYSSLKQSKLKKIQPPAREKSERRKDEVITRPTESSSSSASTISQQKTT